MQKTINYKNWYQLLAYDFTSKSTMILIFFVFKKQNTNDGLVKTNIYYVKQMFEGVYY